MVAGIQFSLEFALSVYESCLASLGHVKETYPV